MFDFLKKSEVLDDPSVQWLCDCFNWCLGNFDADIFHHNTFLVVPSNEFFPGKENSIHGMASLILGQVKQYAGVAHWPTVLVDQRSCQLDVPLRLTNPAFKRAVKGMVIEGVEGGEALVVPYNPDQVGNPEALIASFAHTLAQYLASMNNEPPPGGRENWPQATEVLAVFMGFGLMFTNTALTFQRGGCGGCGGGANGRTGSLSQYDITYALAIFSMLKQIPVKQVTSHMKSALRTYFKYAVKDISKRSEIHDGMIQFRSNIVSGR
ncbi:MAG: hypothetical protein RPU64_03055 [Candidatus Sedimenticola sp. (ex Thyasira tokunagai)]